MQNICNFMNGKTNRQRMIHRLVSRGGVSTQADLRRMLGGRGYRVDPATVSRDIRELGLVKAAGGYATVEDVAPDRGAPPRGVIPRLLRNLATSGNLVILKTEPGQAPSLAVALDRLAWREVAGTLAGDDTVFVAATGSASARRLTRKIRELRP